MTQNSTVALQVVPDLVLAPAFNDADTVAAMSDAFGLRIALDPSKIPQFREGESTKGYIRRIWPMLSEPERGAALTAGIQAVQNVHTFASTAIQVRVWRAFMSGEWRFSPEKPNTFREWVLSALSTEEGTHNTEASLLNTVCEVVAWLAANQPEKLPANPEECFMPGQYRRWRAVAGKLSRLVKEGKEEQVAPIVDAVQDDDVTRKELDQIGRQKSGIPPIVMYEQAPDGTGSVMAKATLTPAQVEYLRRLPNVEWRLQGEQPEGELVEYRHLSQGTSADSETGEVVATIDLWYERVWDGSGWSTWTPLAEAPEYGVVEVHVDDPEIGVEYIRTWRQT